VTDLGLTLSEEEFAKKCDRFFGKAEPSAAGQNLTVFENVLSLSVTPLKLKYVIRMIPPLVI
jgi:hypothetical protein